MPSVGIVECLSCLSQHHGRVSLQALRGFSFQHVRTSKDNHKHCLPLQLQKVYKALTGESYAQLTSAVAEAVVCSARAIAGGPDKAY